MTAMSDLEREAEIHKERMPRMKRGGEKQYFLGYMHGLLRAVEILEKTTGEQGSSRKNQEAV